MDTEFWMKTPVLIRFQGFRDGVSEYNVSNCRILRSICKDIYGSAISLLNTLRVPLSPSSITYAYIPKEVVSGLIKRLGFTDLQFSWNRTFLQNDDRVPENIDMEDIALVGVWWNNGVGACRSLLMNLANIALAQSFYSTAVDRGDNGNGWVELDVVMIRMNTTYTPYGSFGAYSPDNQ